MKVLVSCDEYCYKWNGNFYMRDLGIILIQRYLMVYDQVRLAVRVKNVQNMEQLGKFNMKLTDSRVEIFPLDFFQGPKQYSKCYFSIRSKLRKVSVGIDLAILRLPSTVAFSVLSVLKKNNIPYATELVYDCYDAYTSSDSLINKILWWILHLKQKGACLNAIGVAPVTKHYLQNHYPSSQGALVSYYSTIELKKDFFYQSRNYPFDKLTLTIVHVANQIQFNGRKGHSDLLKVLRLLKDKGIVLDAIFVGEDYQGGIAKCQKLASELGISSQILFTGFLSYKEMRDKLLQCDIAVLPTKAEGLPRVVIEGMAMGLPCVVSKVSGNSELIDDKFLFKYGDIEAIATAIEKLVTDPLLYKEVSLLNFNRSKEYSKEVLDKRRCQFYSELRKFVENV